MIAHVEPLVDFLAEGEGVDEAVLAGGTLAGHHGPDLGAGAASGQAVFSQESHEGFQIFVFHTLDLHGQAGGQRHFAAAEPVGGLRNGPVLPGGDLTVSGDDANVEDVGVALVAQTAQALDALDVVGAQLNGVLFAHEHRLLFAFASIIS